MKIGYACIPLGTKYTTNRKFNLKNFSENKFNECLEKNINDLYEILKYNLSNKIYMFRISSDIVPFASHKINDIKWWCIYNNELKSIGKFINKNSMRVSMHPGQYTVLNSPDNNIVKNAINDIEYHTLFLDSLEVDYTCKVVLHIGGVYGNKNEAIKRFKQNYKLLSQSAQRRLVIENDEKSYNINDVIEISEEMHIPVVFDVLHDELNPSYLNPNYFLNRVSKTWGFNDGSMKVHYSEQDISKFGGAHSKYVNTKKFIEFYNKMIEYNADIMLEVKDKDISAIKCINTITGINKQDRFNQWAKYKYSIMEKNYQIYKECSKIINSDADIANFYYIVDDALSLTEDKGSYINTLYHVWGYLKDLADEKEKNKFLLLIQNNELNSAKKYLNRLCIKYNVEYVLNSYYFLL